MQAAPEKRIAKDGVAYTYYGVHGVHGTDLFSECPSAEQSEDSTEESTEDMQAPLQKDYARKLRAVIDNITDDMNWARLQEISASSGMDATLADIDWSSTLSNVWQEASQNTQRCVTTYWSLETWQQFLFLIN